MNQSKKERKCLIREEKMFNHTANLDKLSNMVSLDIHLMRMSFPSAGKLKR